MPSLVDVYAKFGEVAEAVQLLETQLGNLVLEVAIGSHDPEIIDAREFSRALFEDVDRRTLGQLIKVLDNGSSDAALAAPLAAELPAREDQTDDIARSWTDLSLCRTPSDASDSAGRNRDGGALAFSRCNPPEDS